tara:strand:+ start:70807 stop:72519 length:1713 start_codon:yes stop_codon:yes gene_type:complete
MAQLRRKPVSSTSRKIQNPIAKAMSRAKHSSFYHELSLRGENPLRLLGTPKDIWPGSVTAGTQMVSGKLIAAGYMLENPNNDQNIWPDGDIWRATNLTEKWLEYLHSFGWLKDLNQAVDQDGAKKRAQELVDAWIEQNTKWGEISWRVDIVGQRTTNWLIYAPLILDTDDVIYRGRVLDIMARSARHLMNLSTDLPEGPNALKAIIGLILSGLFVPGGEEWLKEGCSLIKFAIGKEVLVDGGIRSRNPQELLHLYVNFVLLSDSFKQTGRKAPDEISSAISRMASNLKSIIHGDGKLPLFNGAGIQSHEDIYSALLKTGQDDINLNDLEQSGFSRIARGKSLVLMDVGPPAELDMSAAGHSGTHAFEMSSGQERLIVNCGDASFIADETGSGLMTGSRGSAAHSTLVINNKNSSEIREDGLIGCGVTKVTSQRFEQDGHILSETEHDGYVLPFEYLHKRLIYMSDTGESVRGEDIIEHQKMSENGDQVSFDVRFHLHPDVSVAQSKSGNILYLGLAGGEIWQFRYRGAALALEDSIYFGEAGKVSASKQIVLSGKTNGAITTILWSLRLE